MSRRKGSAPRRSCLGCRAQKPQSELIRLAAVSGRLVYDPQRRLGGRGAWLCQGSPDCLALALKRRPWQRAFRTEEALDPSALVEGKKNTSEPL